MKRSVMRLLFAALSVGLTTGQGMAAQSPRDSVQGVWRVVEAAIAGPGARTVACAERPNAEWPVRESIHAPVVRVE
jgi:hypothetical protein